MTDLRLECVATDVSGLANDLIADVGVAYDRVPSLDSLQDSRRMGDRVDCGRLRDESLTVDGGQGWDCGHCGNRGHCRDRCRNWACQYGSC